jgi:hypothetical protein
MRIGRVSRYRVKRVTGRETGGRPMGRFGVVTRYRTHVAEFSPAFWETKDVGGARRPREPGAVAMVSCFGDNRVARRHPDWVQVGPGGMPATRDAPYFDWAHLCPTRPEVRELALQWIRADRGPEGLRLDDVSYARDGFCACAVCREEAARRGMSLPDLHRRVLLEFVQAVRRETSAPLYLTLYPDPYPGRLEEDFGLDVERLAGLVDTFVVPIYDLAYSTTWWVENLARGFRARLNTPFFVELYGLGVDEERLAKAVLVAGAYADGVLVAYDSQLARLRRLASLYGERYGRD